MTTGRLTITACAAAAIALAGCGGDATDGGVSAERAAELRSASQAYADMPVVELLREPAAVDLGRRLFTAHCASCHGADGTGATRGVPNLAAGQLSYGATADAIRTTIARGRQSTMPAMGRQFGEVDIGQLVAFVESLGTDAALSDYEQRGAMLFAEHCAACHGDRGRGLAAQGTPSLADAHWEHGDSMMNIRLVITRGVEAACPAHADRLGDAEIDLLTAYVLELTGAARPN